MIAVSVVRVSPILAVFPLLVAAVLWGARAHGSPLALGMGVLEGGDDRWQPAVQLSFSSDHGYRLSTTYQELSWGPIIQTVALVTAAYEFPFLYPRHMGASVGASYLQESTELDFDPPVDPSFDQTEIQHNLGMSFGVHLHTDSSSPVLLGLSWESHVFAAGLGAGLFLATGRKQTLILHGGFRL